MPLAVTHILTGIILVDIYRHKFAVHKRFITLKTLVVAGLFALLPDIDFLFKLTANIFKVGLPELLQHGGITHTPFFAVLFLIPAIILWKKRKHQQATYLYIGFFMILLHIFLDFLIGGGNYEGVMWLFPFTMQTWKIHLVHMFNMTNALEALDAILLLGWLAHEEVRHKIKDFF